MNCERAPLTTPSCAVRVVRSIGGWRTLARPLPALTPAEEVRRCWPTLQDKYNWSSTSLDLLAEDLKEGEKILNCGEEFVQTNQRKIDRRDLIIRYRPINMTPNHYAGWDAQNTRPLANRSSQPPED